jgi:WD40 repeat protein
VLATLSGPGDSVVSLAFAPDGATLAAGTADNTVRLWKTDPAAVAADICAVAGDHITQAEWTRYITGLPYDPPC